MAEQGKTKAVHCVRGVRDATVEKYRLPGDKREWKHKARNRQALANYLATFADGDGSRIRPSEPTITDHFGWNRATTFRYLDDLEALGIQKRVGRFGGSRGVAIRQLNMNAFVGVAKSPSESQTQTPSESQSRTSESQTQTSESQTQTSESHTACDPTVLDLPTNKPTTTDRPGGGGWSSLEKQHLAAIGKWSHKNRETVDAYIHEHGFTDVAQAMADAVKAGDLETATSKSGAVIQHRMPEYLAKVAAARAAAADKARGDAIQEASIKRQNAELLAHWAAQRARGLARCPEDTIENLMREETPEEFMADDPLPPKP